MTDIAYVSATQLAQLIAARQISCREALDFYLARVAALDRDVNCVVTIDEAGARAAAAAADEALARGDRCGPLHGVPMTVKDSFQTDGMVTTSGVPSLGDYLPREDAWPVARLREAGANIFGKTNLPLYAGDLQTYNEVFGTTTNPYHSDRTPGGSSGGSAAALACGFTPLELGSDIGGSIRIPAHFCGVVGHKPSFGIVPAHGQIPGPPGTFSLADMAVTGPMARHVEDLQLGLDILAGPNRWDRPAWRLELPPPRRPGLDGLRVAAWLDDDACPVDPAMTPLLSRAAQTLADGGAIVDADARPDFSLAKAVDVFQSLLQAAMSGGVARNKIEEFATSTGDTPVDQTRRRMASRHRDWLTNNERRMQLRKRWEEFFESWDVMLLPVAPTAAIQHDHSEPQAARQIAVGAGRRPYLELISWMAPVGACLLPATVIPVGQLENGLPVGIQIAGPYLEDRTTLAVARTLLEALGGCPRPNGF